MKPFLTYFAGAAACVLALCHGAPVSAQSDDCSSATVIAFDATGAFCSGPASNVGATDDGFDFLGIRDNPFAADVWFQFVATQPDVRVEVTGAGGFVPQFVLLQTDCNPTGAFIPYAFGSNLYDGSVATAWAYDLAVGQTYYIAVSGAEAAEGQFELCVEQSSTPAPPAADCATAPLLCSTDAVSVADGDIRGGGINLGETVDELPGEVGEGCFGGGEVSPYWFKFVIDDPGDLVFTITPNDPTDDYDFALYRIDAIDDCAGKELVRCMLSGPNVGEDISEWLPCTGSTGLSASSFGLKEGFGCTEVPGVQEDNNFLSPVQALPGDVYALLVHNSSQSGRGFTLDFEDVAAGLPPTTATFAQPVAAFSFAETSTGCDGATYSFEYTGDRIPGNATTYEWTFGPQADPATAAGPGPHTVTFGDDFDLADVSVTIATAEGCRDESAARSGLVEVTAGIDVEAPAVTDADCDDGTGSVDGGTVTFSPPADADYLYELRPTDGGPVIGPQASPVFDDVPAGTYDAVVSAATATGCDPVTFDGVVVGQGGDIEYVQAEDLFVNDPGCGDAQVVVLLDDPAVAAGRTYAVDGVTQPTFTVTLDTNTTYTITISEGDDCPVEFELTTPASPSGPAVTVGATETECTDPTGTITIAVVDPDPAVSYEYSISGGDDFQAEPLFEDLPGGTYAAVAREVGSNCESEPVSVTVDDADGPELSAADITLTAPQCVGADDGAIEIGGAASGLEYSVDDGATYQAGGAFADLEAGDYIVVARDIDGCTTRVPVTLEAPEPFVPVVATDGPTCAEAGDGSIEVVDPVGAYEYALDEVADGAFQAGAVFADLDAGTYTLRVRATTDPFCESDTLGVTLVPDIVAGEPLALGDPELRLPYGEPFTLPVGELTGLGTSAEYGYGGLTDSLACTDATCATIVLVPTRSGTLTVTATNELGCLATGQIEISVRVGEGVFMPTAFSPDGLGDPANELWRPRFTAAVGRVRSVRVFDRWGALVYVATDLSPGDPEVGWDGTRLDSGDEAEAGVYVAMVVADVAGEERVVTSDVALLR